ncbi:uncharacterized protein F4807DRAFT_471862 [Annulohypoxylon truncatum]|uniref:uncharacterized protein n=1 Tax=Annulohypoxylon truncatum TaxID=327061 RepID=UPI0020078BEC|nr:uncharacterized protein F4807DRAFT_471862 [Annulohypoxylon truncatum]KAI1204681.1 hypothetical protein F4807DRAFT_471862 [Annulohypoxylon truncatum]
MMNMWNRGKSHRDSNRGPSTENSNNRTHTLKANVPEETHSTFDEGPNDLLDSHSSRPRNTRQVHASQSGGQSASVFANTGSLPLQPGVSPSDLETRLKEAEQSLKKEKQSRLEENASHERVTNNLQAKLDVTERNLETERNEHQHTKSRLTEKENAANHQRQLMLDAVGELNRFLRGNQVHNQSTDHELIQKAMKLRIAIRDFAILYFGNNVNMLGSSQASLESLNQFLRIPLDYLETYISFSSKRVNLIRAFLWAYLYERVFNRFYWSWQGAGTAFCEMRGFLYNLVDGSKNADPRGERKFHTWRANTANLLVEAMRLNETTVTSDGQQFIQQWTNTVSQLLGPFKSSDQQGYLQGLEGIITQSLELDKEICKQIANIEWVHCEELPCTFVPDSMELELSQEHQGNNKAVTLVLGPGLVRRGKSSGDDFDVMERLLKTQVYCDRPPSKFPGTRRAFPAVEGSSRQMDSG